METSKTFTTITLRPVRVQRAYRFRIAKTTTQKQTRNMNNENQSEHDKSHQEWRYGCVECECRMEREANPESAPLPLSVSHHGDSTIIIDATGHWVTGQVKASMAESIVRAFNSHAKLLSELKKSLAIIQGWEQAQAIDIAEVADSVRATIASHETSNDPPRMTSAEHNAFPKGRWS